MNMDKQSFCAAVDAAVSEQYDIDDSGDLCFILLERGELRLTDSIDYAARIVAQHIDQA